MALYNIATYTTCMLWLKDIFSGFEKVLRKSFKKTNLLSKQIVNSRIEIVKFISDLYFWQKNHQKVTLPQKSGENSFVLAKDLPKLLTSFIFEGVGDSVATGLPMVTVLMVLYCTI